jgi:uncharacterized membrane-anchored protein
METMRESWTDERMDDLSQRMDRGFDQVRAEMNRGFERADKDMRHGFNQVDEEMRDLRAEMNTRFDALQQTMILAAAGVIASLVGLVATQL